MLFFLAFHFSLSLTPNCRNWSPNYSVLVFIMYTCNLVQQCRTSRQPRTSVLIVVAFSSSKAAFSFAQACAHVATSSSTTVFHIVPFCACSSCMCARIEIYKKELKKARTKAASTHSRSAKEKGPCTHCTGLHPRPFTGQVRMDGEGDISV
jgi:hypothetical protein